MSVSIFLIGGTDSKFYSMTDGIQRPSANFGIDEVIKWAEVDPFWAVRAKAINAYAELEGSLAHLLSIFGEMPWSTAIEMFYKITSTQARNAIFEKLLHKKYGVKFNLFWNGYVKELRTIDLKRNEIVHWIAAAQVLINSQNTMLVGVCLVPPARLHDKKEFPMISTDELRQFTAKCSEFTFMAREFSNRLKPPDLYPELGEPWIDKFQLPFVYPLPEQSPLFQRVPKPEIHPQSFPPSLRFVRPTPDGKSVAAWTP